MPSSSSLVPLKAGSLLELYRGAVYAIGSAGGGHIREQGDVLTRDKWVRRAGRLWEAELASFFTDPATISTMKKEEGRKQRASREHMGPARKGGSCQSFSSSHSTSGTRDRPMQLLGALLCARLAG
jgi:hypothetical protein